MRGVAVLCNIFVICLFQVYLATANPTHCDFNISGELVNKTQCLRRIGDAATDTNRFWFGEWYVKNCPPGPARDTLKCSSLITGTKPHSIASILFTEGTFDKSKLSTYIDVVYHSEAGEYEGCGNTFKRNSTSFRLNPLRREDHAAWTVRNTPDMTWAARSDTQYTLLVVDGGHVFTHGIFINIPGNDLSRSEVIKSYHGSLNMKSIPNPLAFVLFEQTIKNITLLPRYTDPSDPGFVGIRLLNISEFAADHQLDGPVGMNWVSAKADAYSVEIWRPAIENCAMFVERALANNSRPFLPPNPKLNVFIEAEFNSIALSFTSCCKNYSYSDTTVALNPIGNKHVKPVHVRSQTTKSVQLKRTGQYMNASEAFGNYLTMLAVDADPAIPSVGTADRPAVHWMVMNIREGDLKKGDEVLDYRGPMPPDQAPHTYYFLLYEQSSKLLTNNTHRFAGDKCDKSYTGRCLFNVTGFINENDLKLVGVTWMLSEISPYVRYSYIQSGKPASKVCAGVPGYADPCPKSAATISAGNIVAMSFCTTLQLIIAAMLLQKYL